jgi:hypothetical protein
MIVDGQLVEIIVASLEFAKLFFMTCNLVIELSLICKTLFPKQNLSNAKHKLLAKVSKLATLLFLGVAKSLIEVGCGEVHHST